ncbi:MAG: hypothetical protein ACYC0B_02045 [Gemmatimonadaceae bacterium]
MTLGHPLVDAAIDDMRLTPTHLKSFRVMWRELDFREYREKKSEVLAAQIGCDRANASRALQKLVEYGYLDEGPRSDKGVGTYRLGTGTPAAVHNQHRSVNASHSRRRVRFSL